MSKLGKELTTSLGQAPDRAKGKKMPDMRAAGMNVEVPARKVRRTPRDETDYLLKSPKNATRLLKSIADLNAGKGVARRAVPVKGKTLAC